jgi:hypothetical protein
MEDFGILSESEPRRNEDLLSQELGLCKHPLLAMVTQVGWGEVHVSASVLGAGARFCPSGMFIPSMYT